MATQLSLNARVVNASRIRTILGCESRLQGSITANADSWISRKSEGMLSTITETEYHDSYSLSVVGHRPCRHWRWSLDNNLTSNGRNIFFVQGSETPKAPQSGSYGPLRVQGPWRELVRRDPLTAFGVLLGDHPQ